MWSKLDDGAFSHRKFLDLHPSAIGLWAMGLSYCAKQLTEGFIPKAQVSRLVAVTPAEAFRLAEMLVKAGLWEVHPDGYQVHDYLDYNPRAAQIHERRERSRVRFARWYEGTRTANRVSNAVPNGVANGVSNSVPNASPVPVPSRNTKASLGSPLSLPSRAHGERQETPGGPDPNWLVAPPPSWLYPDGCVRPEFAEQVPEHKRARCEVHQ
jgi:hypothetical protein